MDDAVSVNSNADIIKTSSSAIANFGTGTLTINSGTISVVNQVAVDNVSTGTVTINGASFLPNFAVASSDWELAVSGNNLVLAETPEACDDCPTTVALLVNDGLPLRIYPNPVQPNGALHIESEALKAGDKLEIFDLNGKLISIHFASGVENSINIGSIPQGIYLLRLAGERSVKFEVR